ncbi:hypothetical protein F5148DRAFT_1349906 [Russula earlei]|uniref:Uncharacterized protein n=1 Tax=Russula earlei TaxID=71964 RepID=A0ACC0TTJ9_9AGAM|nr:hypothetical protein F5148DRAFT_1349906 [Russula earlei]
MKGIVKPGSLLLVCSLFFVTSRLNGQGMRIDPVPLTPPRINVADFPFDSIVVLDNRFDTTLYVYETGTYPVKAFAFLPAAPVAIRQYVHTATANLPGGHRTLLINIKQWRAPNVGMLYNTVSDVEAPYLVLLRNYLFLWAECYEQVDSNHYRQILTINKGYFYKNNNKLIGATVATMLDNIIEASALAVKTRADRVMAWRKKPLLYVRNSTEFRFATDSLVRSMEEINVKVPDTWGKYAIMNYGSRAQFRDRERSGERARDKEADKVKARAGNGIYRTIDDFKRNHVQPMNVYLEFDTKDSVYKVANEISWQTIPMESSIWAIKDEDVFYYRVGMNTYLPMQEEGGSFSFDIPSPISNMYQKFSSGAMRPTSFNTSGNPLVNLIVMAGQATAEEAMHEKSPDNVSKKEPDTTNGIPARLFFRHCLIDLDNGDIRVKPRDENKAEQIYRATLKLVKENGLAGITMQAVAKEADMATGTLYIYFKNKEALIVHLFEACIQNYVSAFFSNYDVMAPFKVGFHTIWMNIIQYRSGHFDESVFLEQCVHSPFIDEDTRVKVKKMFNPLHQLIERGKAERLIKNIDIFWLMSFMLGGVNELAKRAAYHNKQLTDEVNKYSVKKGYPGGSAGIKEHNWHIILNNKAGAQEKKTITLNEAVSLSLQNSKQLKLSSARIAEAVAATKEAMERKLPEASVSGSWLWVSKPKINLKTGNDTAATSIPNVSQAFYGIANVSMPIYAGGKVKYGIESAKLLEQASKMDADNDRQGVIMNTIAAYINLYKAGAAVKLVEEDLAQSRQRDTDFSNLEKNGLLARNDMLKAQLETSNKELTLLDAQNNIQYAMVNMNLLLGLPETTVLAIDSASIQQTGEYKTIQEYEQLADSSRKDIRALAYRQQAAAADIKVAKGDLYPSIAATGGYIAADIPNFLTITNAVNIGVGVKYSLSSLWKTESKVQQAKAREQQLVANKGLLLDQIHLSISKAYLDYLSAVKKIEVYNKAVEQATENYRINKNKYTNNLLTLTDLLDADVAQLQARLNLSFAKADVVLAYHTLLQKAGLLNQ